MDNYSFLRMGIIITVSLIVSFAVSTSHKYTPKGKALFLSVFIVLFAVIVMTIPSPKSNEIWNSPEEAFTATHSEKFITNIHGESSDLILFKSKKSSATEATVLIKDKEGYRFDDEQLNSYFLGERGSSVLDCCYVTIYEYAETDYYLCIDGLINVNISISDSCGSEITRYNHKTIEGLEYPNNNIPSVFYGYIEDFSDDYYIVINGTRYDIDLEDALF